MNCHAEKWWVEDSVLNDRTDRLPDVSRLRHDPRRRYRRTPEVVKSLRSTSGTLGRCRAANPRRLNPLRSPDGHLVAVSSRRDDFCRHWQVGTVVKTLRHWPIGAPATRSATVVGVSGMPGVLGHRRSFWSQLDSRPPRPQPARFCGTADRSCPGHLGRRSTMSETAEISSRSPSAGARRSAERCASQRDRHER
jgi:hypothetical protein